VPIIILPEKDEKIDIEKGVISVEIMRRLYDETRTKTEGERIIIIDYAERMTTQAQNAFLKLLEEPGDDVYFILVSNTTSKLAADNHL
jgi:DNA polymerase-3 subunit delta'